MDCNAASLHSSYTYADDPRPRLAVVVKSSHRRRSQLQHCPKFGHRFGASIGTTLAHGLNLHMRHFISQRQEA